MKVYCLLLEGVPSIDNEERKEAGGAYINCWVKAKDKSTAKDKAAEYIASAGWEIVKIKEVFICERIRYVHYPESLECYDQAVRCGIGTIFHIWPIDAEDGDVTP